MCPETFLQSLPMWRDHSCNVKKWLIKWPQCLLSFFNCHLAKASFLKIGNQLTSYQSIKKETNQIQQTIYSSISAHLSYHNILSTNQHGFYTGRSCDTQLLEAINDFHQCLDSGTHIDALFLDFTKAFDKVSHRKLCHKLLCYGVIMAIYYAG